MGRLLILLGVVLLLLWLARGRSARKPDASLSERSSADRHAAPAVMRACAQCGVHVPEPDAIIDGGNAFCCAEHQAAGPRSRGGAAP
jgi:uncharacterized protein